MRRTNTDATSASYTTYDTQVLDRVFEFMHQALATTFGLVGAGIVSRGVFGKLSETAGIPATQAFSAVLGSFIFDIKAGAGGAGKVAAAGQREDQHTDRRKVSRHHLRVPLRQRGKAPAAPLSSHDDQ